MTKRNTLTLLFLFGSLLLLSAKAPKALIITGQHTTHNWAVSHVILNNLLTDDGFEVDIAMSPQQGEDMSTFHPNFDIYDLVVMDYNGDMWCEKMKVDFVAYVRGGKGGLFLYHAANTIFREWEEYQKITALGAFGGRGVDTEGYYTTWKEGGVVKYEGKGVVGHHGKRHDFTLTCRNEHHPAVDATLPIEPQQYDDEIYDQTKGPANIKDVLYTAYSETETGGTGREEILVFTVDYYDARIFHSMIGHAGKSLDNTPAMTSETFEKIFLAGARWAANYTK